jgi:hypothetical protein
MNTTQMETGAQESVYGYMGYIQCKLGDSLLWTQYTGIDRMSRVEAEIDAQVMEISILDVNKI